MERFAFKIDKSLKANLYKICRLCGIDGHCEKVLILKEKFEDPDVPYDVDAEPELSQKIRDLIGFEIHKDDKMPQMICTICVDKINDFFEFREMCFATNIQTRKLLGLKDAPKKIAKINAEVKSEPLAFVDRRGRKRKSEEIDTKDNIKKEAEKLNPGPLHKVTKKMRLALLKQKNQVMTTESETPPVEIKDEFPVVNASFEKLKQTCLICKQRFITKLKLERHKAEIHVPNVPRFYCLTCDETLKKKCDVKSHQLWHKMTKTYYSCGLCTHKTATMNLFTRHLRDHNQQLVTPLLVLDRECSGCHTTFATNFLYNTHPCAVRTRKCGGCNRQMKNDLDYQRHAPTCDKIYLKPSKHICAPTESVVRVKNENDAEATTSVSLPLTGQLCMTPVVSLTRLAIDPKDVIVAAALSTKPTKKTGKKKLSKKDLKRVDDLLKSTMDTLVSIKHEPEIHVETDAPTNADHSETALATVDDEANDTEMTALNDDDFHNRDDDSDDEDLNPTLFPIVQLETEKDVVVKQEKPDNTQHSVATPVLNAINIKKELPDSGYEDSVSTAATVASSTTAVKMPVLKLKITKEHGTLNSSLVDDGSISREKKKKKKKRKDSEKQATEQESTASDFAQMPLPGIIHIKQERPDDDYIEDIGSDKNKRNIPPTIEATSESVPHTLDMQPEATVMTTIPMMQLQISSICSGVEFNESIEDREEEQVDVKPNRAELDRWLQKENNTIPDETTETETVEQNVEVNVTDSFSVLDNQFATKQPQNSAPKKISASSGKAVKSTGGAPRLRKTPMPSEMPKIVAVSSGVEMDSTRENVCANHEPPPSIAMNNIRIKAEPRDDGYEYNHFGGAEPMDCSEIEAAPLSTENATDGMIVGYSNDHEQAFINSIDFNNINIKQEKDIDVSEPQLTSQYHENAHSDAAGMSTYAETLPNDVTEHNMTDECLDTIHEEAEDDEEQEDEDDTTNVLEEEDEQREYREIECPPLLTSEENDVAVNNPMPIDAPMQSKDNSILGLVIANVYSQAKMEAQQLCAKLSPEIHDGPVNKSNKSNTKSDVLKLRSSMSPPLNEAEIEVVSNTKTISGKVTEDAETLDKAQPFYTNASKTVNTNHSDTSTFQSVDEEHQNQLNHAVLLHGENSIDTETAPTPITEPESQATEPVIRIAGTATLELHPYLEDISSNSCSVFSNPTCEDSESACSSVKLAEHINKSLTVSKLNKEETENFINESADATAHAQQQHSDESQDSNSVTQQSQRAMVIDDDNVNEIAENNNNANIERELLDDSSNSNAMGAPEQPNTQPPPPPMLASPTESNTNVDNAT